MSFLVPLIKPLAYISLPVFVVRQLANQPTPSPLRYYARLVVYVGTLFTVASCSFVAAVGMSVLGRSNETNYLVARTFYFLAHRALDIKVEIEGEEFLETRPAVYMANHQSMLDILILGRVFPKKAAIMAKKSLQYTPLGPWMSLSGNFFIDRGNNARAVRSVEAAGEKMKRDGISLWMYPEGTRHMSEKPSLLPFKKGGFHLAVNAGLPVIPIVVENYWNIYHQGVFDRGVIKVKVLQPISTTSMTVADVGDLTTRVREVMLETLQEISPKITSEKSSSPTLEAITEKLPAETVSGPKQEVSTPLEPLASLTTPSIGVILPVPVEDALSSIDSSSSLASSMHSEGQRRGREDGGAETEEDEGMVLVGRPRNN